jgi:hypothetical protein
MNKNGIYIEGITRQEFFDAIQGVMEVVNNKVNRREYSVNELSGITGYSPAHLRKIIKQHDIPFRKTGRGISVPHESLHHIPMKSKLPPGLIPS